MFWKLSDHMNMVPKNHGTKPKVQCKGLFTQAIFVAATRCNFCHTKVAPNFIHVQNPWDIASTNHTENRTWFTHAILKL